MPKSRKSPRDPSAHDPNAPGANPDESPLDEGAAGHPSAPGAATPADEELSLEDYGERAAMKPRLPERREPNLRPPAERLSLSEPVRETPTHLPPPQETAFESNPAARLAAMSPQARQGRRDAIDDEIDELAGVPAAPVPSTRAPQSQGPAAAPASAAVPDLTPPADELDEFIARTSSGPSREEETAAAGPRRPLSMGEKIALGAVVAVLAGGLIWFFATVLASRPEVAEDVSEKEADLPLTGDLVRITALSSGWRDRKETDRVGRMEVILPKPGDLPPAIVPRVNFTIDSSASKTGYLRFLIKDGRNRVVGDTRIVKIVGGRLTPSDRGEIISGPAEGEVYASLGFTDYGTLLSYTSGRAPRWRFEIAESPDYGANDDQWKRLGVFEIGDKYYH